MTHHRKTFSGEPIKVPDWAVKLYLSEDTKRIDKGEIL